ncbi:MAG: TolC family protein [Bacteroidetes bacterium]|nr:MAG: TolC family protein [Bacteroidota bacterium]
MKRFAFILVFLLALSSIVLAQSNTIDNVLEEIEKNNTGLAAYQKQQEAQSLAHKTGIYPDNPEFEYAWFSGSPSTLGNKTGISVRQHFSFPTTYFHKNRIAHARNDQLQLEYEKHRSDLLLEARFICLELVYYNAMSTLLDQRLQHAQRIADAYSRMLETGETNIIEHNKARLNLLDLQKQDERISIEKKALLQQLTALNGGIEISFSDANFEPVTISGEFDNWYAQAEKNNPVLQNIKQEIEINRKEEKLQRASNLPGFNVGYVSELLTHEKFRGFAIGISIPLWENKNTLQHAKARTSAMQSVEHDQQLQYYNFLKTQHSRATSLQESAMEYRNLVQTIDNTELLATAWTEGEISLTGYLLELSYLYQSMDKILEMELELHQTLAVMNQYMD